MRSYESRDLHGAWNVERVSEWKSSDAIRRLRFKLQNERGLRDKRKKNLVTAYRQLI
jgi:hypothetical protein